MTQMRALQLVSDKELVLNRIDPPPPPGPGEVQLRVLAVGLKTLSNYVNHIAETPLDPHLVADAMPGVPCPA